MSVVPEPHKWDLIPEMAGTLVYERKNELWRCCSFSLFCSIKTIQEWNRKVKKKACCYLPHAVIDKIEMLRF